MITQIGAFVAALCLTDAQAPAETGSVTYRPAESQEELPEGYRLGEYCFDYRMARKYDLKHTGVEVFRLTFRSPVTTDYEVNNTVHAEYYRPKGSGPYPAVIILDVLGGNQELSRGLGLMFSQQKVAALFIQMAYYGPRRPTEGRVRLLSTDIERSLEGIRQTVLDCRCGAAWLETRPEVDGRRMGIVGTSLGSFMAGLTGAMEPRLKRVALLFGGGGFAEGYYDHPQAKPVRDFLELVGGGKDALQRLLAPVDPLTYAARLGRRNLLMVAASKDVIVPAKMARLLWEATGRQRIVWFDTDHYGAAFYALPTLFEVLKHFRDWPAEAGQEPGGSSRSSQ